MCDIDTVTVLEQWGSRLSNGFTCALGEFHPIPAEEVEELLRDEDGKRVTPNAIEVEKGDLPDDDDAAAPDDAAAHEPAPDEGAN